MTLPVAPCRNDFSLKQIKPEDKIHKKHEFLEKRLVTCSNSRDSRSSPSTTGAPSPSTTSTIASSTSTPSATPSANPDPPAKSKAWIAGPAIAGLAVLAGIVFGAVFLRRRQSSRSTSTPQIGSQQHPGSNRPVMVSEHKPSIGYHEQKSPQMVNSDEQPYYSPSLQSPPPPHSPQPHGVAEMAGNPVNHTFPAELGPRY